MKKILYFIALSLFIISCGGSKKVTSTDTDFRATAPAPGPAPVISLDEPGTFQLDNGLTVIVVENNKLPTVNASLFFDVPDLVEGDKAGMTSFFGPVMQAGTQKYTKDQIDEELDFYAIDLFTSSRSIGFNSLKKQMPKAIYLMKEVLFNSTFSNQDVLDKLVKQSVTGLESSSKNPDAIMGRVSNALLYGQDHPWGEYATAETYQNVSLADLKGYYDTYFKPNIAYLTIVGDITVPEAKKIAEENFSDWKAADVPTFEYDEPSNPTQTEVAIIDLPGATQSNIAITNLQDLKKSNDDFFASILGNHMLGASTSSKLFLNLREDKGYTYGAYSSLRNNYKMPARFSASGKFRNEVTDSSVIELMKELKSASTNAFTPEEIKIAKSEQTGQFALRLERPETIARFARTVLLEDLESDFYANFLKNIDAQSPASVLESMNRYVKPDNARIIIVGKAEDIADDVKALGYPVKFYDIWANEVADPTIKQDVGDVNAMDVINKAIDAMGGKEQWSSVKTMRSEYSVEVPGVPMEMIGDMKVMAPNKSAVEISAVGMGVVNKVIFDGETGYNEQMGQKVPMSEAEVEEAKWKNAILEELDFTAENVRIDNIVDVNGEQAYKVIVTSPAGKEKERYYGIESGYLLRTMEVMEMAGQKISNTVTLSDYQEFEGKMIPKNFVIEAGSQTIKMNLLNVIFNDKVSEQDFK